jgi:hypothetical protein
MTLIHRICSLLTLASLFVMGPALGRSLLLWFDQKRVRSPAGQQAALGISIMLGIASFVAVYGGIWKMNPKLVAWYDWIGRSLPISGDVEVTGSVDVSGNVDANITNEPIAVTVSR